ncbi:MAG TPA: UbiA family prenyltransferase [Candidatus Limnocylindria bacterium]|nr:UbiA family prenyltransferase [Candidatus Limnocylindria bacterium]
MVAILRLVHPAPTVAVVTLSAALAFILASQSGPVSLGRVALTTAAVLGSQVLTGALNDWADRDRDRLARRRKPIAEGRVTPRVALVLAAAGGALQLAASVPLGALAMLIGLAASASAVAYNLWLSRTPLSVLPYLVSFGLLPLWIAAGMDVPMSRVALAPLLVGPFAAAAHLANTLRDFDTDLRTGSRNLTQVLGPGRAFAIAFGLAMAVGIGVGASFVLGGNLRAPTAVLGLAGLAAVVQGVAGPGRLWNGMLVAAVLWTAAWALGTG